MTELQSTFAALQDRPYERAGSARKRSSAGGASCAKLGRSLWSSRTPLQLHQRTFATTIKVVGLGPMLSTSDPFGFLKKFADGRVAIAHHGPRDVAGWSMVR